MATEEVKKLENIKQVQIEQTQTLEKINKSIEKQTSILNKPDDSKIEAQREKAKSDVEGRREQAKRDKSFKDTMAGILKSALGTAGKGAKAGGNMLAKFLKFGLSFIMLPFLTLIGVIAGTISGIMKAPEVKALMGFFKGGAKFAGRFLSLIGKIAMWMIDLPAKLLGGKGMAHFFKARNRLFFGKEGIFGKVGSVLSNMFGGVSEKFSAIMKNEKIVKVMGNVAKFVRPLTRIAFWVFSVYEFLKGWGKADEIFGRGEGEATIIEKFASGIGGIIDFASMGFIETEAAAIALKKTFDFFKLAVTKPEEAWKLVVKWWDDFSFKESIVEPIVKAFDEFPQKVKDFIKGPLSNFGSSIATMMKNFIFGEKKEGEDAKTGGLLGLLKGIFTAKNISNAITGVGSMMVGFYKMLGSLVLIPFFGAGEWKLMDWNTWGGLFGWFVKRFKNMESEGDSLIMGGAEIIVSIAKFIGSIFWHEDGESGLLQKALKWFKEMLAKFDVVQHMKNVGKKVKDELFGSSEEKKKQSEERKKRIEEQKKAQGTGSKWYDPGSWFDSDEKKKPQTSLGDRFKNLGNWMWGDDQMKGSGINFAKGQTRKSSWSGQTDDTKMKMAVMGGMFKGGVRVTSGYRDAEKQDLATLNRKDNLATGYSAATQALQKRAGLTDEELTAGAGTEARQRGIDKMRAAGWGSQHEHGNAIDFSYPEGYSEKSFGALKAKLTGAFPGSVLVKEKDHLHMQFNAKNTGVQIAQLQQESNNLNRSGSGGSGNSGTVNNIKAGDSNNNFTIESDATDKASKNSREIEATT